MAQKSKRNLRKRVGAFGLLLSCTDATERKDIMGKTQIYLSELGISAAVATFTAKYELLFYLLLIFAVSMVLDFISGMGASKKEALAYPDDKTKGWSSKKGLMGIIKKFGYICIVAVAVIIDVILMRLTDLLGVSMPMNTFFSVLVLVWFILNECLSIIENAGRMGVVELPAFLTKVIAVLKDTVEDKADRNILEESEGE